MLELGRKRSVHREHRPLVVHDLGLVAADVDHRFDGEDHAGLHALVFAPSAEVRDLRRHVELAADAVADIVANDRAALAFGILLNRGTDVADTIAVFHLCDAELEAAACRLHHEDRFVARLAHVERHARVTVVTVLFWQISGDVDIDDVAFGKDLVAGNPVANACVHARAHAFGKALVIERRWIRLARDDVFVDEAVDLVGCDARADHLPHRREAISRELAGPPHVVKHARRHELDGRQWIPQANRRTASRTGPQIVERINFLRLV